MLFPLIPLPLRAGTSQAAISVSFYFDVSCSSASDGAAGKPNSRNFWFAGFLEEFLDFWGYHIPKDGRRGWKEKHKVPKY